MEARRASRLYALRSESRQATARCERAKEQEQSYGRRRPDARYRLEARELTGVRHPTPKTSLPNEAADEALIEVGDNGQMVAEATAEHAICRARITGCKRRGEAGRHKQVIELVNDPAAAGIAKRRRDSALRCAEALDVAETGNSI
jgi:hypothetical protein